MVSPEQLLQRAYDHSMRVVATDDVISSGLSFDMENQLDLIVEKSESAKAVLTVVLTSLVYKILYPQQDIRNHQNSIEEGYSGRTFDTKYITPFLKKMKFPSMAESGWLTRSLEQKVPYDSDYPGAIRPKKLKEAFLATIAFIQKGEQLEECLHYLLQGLIIQRNKQQIDLAKPVNLPIDTIIRLLTQHFEAKYISEGASRLPVLAIYATYQCLLKEAKRFTGKSLLKIESHTSADLRSGRIGDVDIVDKDGRPFEAVEVKHGIPITA